MKNRFLKIRCADGVRRNNERYTGLLFDVDKYNHVIMARLAVGFYEEVH
jgi:hypothetical protein